MSETSSHFVAVCPNCLQTLRVKYSYSGNHVRCKHCEHKFRALAPDDLMMTPTSAEYPAVPAIPSRPAAERMTVSCPGCSAALSVRRELAGQHVRCKNCDHKFLVEKIAELPVSPRTRVAERDLFDHLYGSSESADTTEPSPQVAEGELAAIRARSEQLQADLATLQEQHSRLEMERDSVAGQLEQLRGEQALLQSVQQQSQEERDRLDAELASIRHALGDLPPGEIAELRTERDALRGEIDEVRRQAELASAEASRQHDLNEAVALRDQELLQAQHQVEALTMQIQNLHGTVNDVRAQRDQIEERVRDLEEELTKTLAQHEELGGNRDSIVARHEQELHDARQHVEQLTQQVQDLDSALNGSRAQCDQQEHRVRELERALAQSHSEHEAVTGRLREHADELAAKESEIARLTAGQTEAEDQARQLGDELARRDQEFREARQHIEDLTQQIRNLDENLSGSRADRDQLEHRVRELDEALTRSHSNHEDVSGRLREHADELAARGSEIARLTALHAETEDRASQLHGGLAERDDEISRLREQLASANSAHAALQARVNELIEVQDTLTAERQMAASRDHELNEARHQIEQLSEQIRNLSEELNGAHAQSDRLDGRVRELEEVLARAHAEHEEVSSRLRDHADELAARDHQIAGLVARQTEKQDCVKPFHAGPEDPEDVLDLMLEQLVSANSQDAALQVRVDELLEAQEKAKVEYHGALEAQQARLRAEFESLAEAESARQAEQLAAAQAQASENALLVEKLRAEILTLAGSHSAPDLDLEAARQEIADLRRRLYEKESSQQTMSSLLEGMGIRLH
jgi:chromosome segregation ATPase/ribosomal protein L37AE/L43A